MHWLWLKKKCFLPVFKKPSYTWIADPGKARGCSINSLVIHWLIHSLSQPFPPTALRRRHAQTVRDSTSSNKINYVIVIKNFLNPEGHQNPFSSLKVTAIYWRGGFCPLVKLHREGFAPVACAAGLFLKVARVGDKICQTTALCIQNFSFRIWLRVWWSYRGWRSRWSRAQQCIRLGGNQDIGQKNYYFHSSQ